MTMNNYDLLVIGNGFDLNLGYKTKYSDFFQALILTYKFDKYEDYLIEVKNTFNFEICENFYLTCVSEKENYFIKYFLSKNALNYNWCDIESELSSILKSFDACLNSMLINDGKSYLIDFSEVENDLILNNIGEKRWGYLTLMCEKKNNYILIEEDAQKVSSRLLRKENKEKLIERFVKSLYSDFSLFKQLLKIYLVCASKMITSRKLLNEKFELITFNYTTMLEIDRKISIDDIYYIHGNLNSEIVLGIDPAIEFNNSYFNVFDKSIQSLTLEKGKYNLEDFVTSAQDIAYIGLSFDVNDNVSLYPIISYDGAIHTVFYYDEDDRIKKSVNIKKLIGSEKFSNMLFSNKLVFKQINDIIVEK